MTTKVAALEAYITRIGAEELNFRRYIVRNYKGTYYTERCIIRIGPDGTITVTNKEYAPTKDEQEKIKGALMGVDWPRAIKVGTIDGLKEHVKQDSMLFEFRDYDGKDDIIMVQERVNLGGGEKKFRPWTFFSDGQWRCMEPDGPLPFWRPKPTGLVRFMVHEGGKAAMAVDDLVKDPSRDHPWKEELAKYEHWGMIGGALAPHRTDYVALKKRNPIEVVYVCDNDWAGKSALQKISREYGGAMKGIKFDKDFKEGWDLADPMPEKLFAPNGRYIGRPLHDFIEYATYATEIVPNPEGKGKGVVRLRDSFKEEWSHCVTPEVFIRNETPARILIASEFNNQVSPYSDADDTARLLKKDATSKSVVLRYAPDRKPGIYVSEEGGGRYFNTHVPAQIKTEKGDTTHWLNFMEHLVVDQDDRNELLRWCATLIARPDVKMLYGVLLISEAQGVGKGTLGEKILAPLIGANNTSYPNENEIVDSNFNYWSAHKRLAVVHEIYAGHSAKGYNRLKSIITDKYITVSKKYQANYEIENWMHVFACSNSTRALLLSDDDRRWFVPKITEKKLPATWWIELNRWLIEDNGLGVIKWWCENWLKTNKHVVKGDSAPWSTLKREMIEDNMSPGKLLVAQTLDRIKADMNGSPVLIADSALVQLVKDQIYEGRQNDRLEKAATLRRVAKSRGWFISDARAFVKDWGTLSTGPRLICSDQNEAFTAPGELAKAGRELFRVSDFISQTKDL